MKTFRFTLARVLHIREAQLKTEEGKLEALRAQRRHIENEIENLRQAAQRSRNSLAARTTLTNVELMALQSFEKYSERETAACHTRIASQDGLIQKQMAVVVEAKRNVRLLEKLREKQMSEWRAEEGRELAGLADDFSAAQWARR